MRPTSLTSSSKQAALAAISCRRARQPKRNGPWSIHLGNQFGHINLLSSSLHFGPEKCYVRQCWCLRGEVSFDTSSSLNCFGILLVVIMIFFSARRASADEFGPGVCCLSGIWKYTFILSRACGQLKIWPRTSELHLRLSPGRRPQSNGHRVSRRKKTEPQQKQNSIRKESCQ